MKFVTCPLGFAGSQEGSSVNKSDQGFLGIGEF